MEGDEGVKFPFSEDVGEGLEGAEGVTFPLSGDVGEDISLSPVGALGEVEPDELSSSPPTIELCAFGEDEGLSFSRAEESLGDGE